MHPILNIALRVVREAGSNIARYYEQKKKEEKNNKLFLNETEKNMCHTINFYYPSHTIKAMDGDIKYSGNSNIEWLIAPLVGKNNFHNRISYFAVTAAVKLKHYMEIVVVYDPIHNEVFTATRGRGLTLNGRRMKVIHYNNINNALVATDQCSIKTTKILENNNFQNTDFRCTGCTLLDIIYVALGRFSGCLKTQRKELDSYIIESGKLFLQESGGKNISLTIKEKKFFACETPKASASITNFLKNVNACSS